MSARMNDHSVPTNHVVLYVKAGWDGVSYGACPFCQRFYMVLDLKAKAGSLTYDIITVNMARPLAEFKKFASKLPVLKHGEEVVMDSDEIMQYIDDNFPVPDLRYDNSEAHSACLDIFSKFSFYVKNVSHTAEYLLKELVTIDRFLERTGQYGSESGGGSGARGGLVVVVVVVMVAVVLEAEWWWRQWW